MVGQGNGFVADVLGAANEFRREQVAVAEKGMSVQIDHEGVSPSGRASPLRL